MQLMHGSMVSTIIDTSWRPHPCSILTIAGMLMFVGVLTLALARFRVPSPFT